VLLVDGQQDGHLREALGLVQEFDHRQRDGLLFDIEEVAVNQNLLYVLEDFPCHLDFNGSLVELRSFLGKLRVLDGLALLIQLLHLEPTLEIAVLPPFLLGVLEQFKEVLLQLENRDLEPALQELEV